MLSRPNLTLVDFWNHSNAMEDQPMIIGERLRALREEKKFSQGEIEKRTGLLRCYTSRVENGHTVPSVETLEKFARALEIPMYQLFHEGEEPPKLPNLPKRKSTDDIAWGSSGRDAHMLAKFCRLFSRMEKGNRELVLFTAQKMARRKALQGVKG
jgi:transcriptional regulator with XRE-family HTH domain